MIDEHDDSINGQLTWGTLTKVDDSGDQQLVAADGIYGQTIGEAVRLQLHGASGVPPIGAQGLFLLPGGRFDRAVLLGLEHAPSRPRNLPGGAKAIYDQAGNIMKLLGADGAVFDFTQGKGWSVTCKGATITSKNGDISVDPGSSNLYLGGTGAGGMSPVSTVNGPSRNVFAAT